MLGAFNNVLGYFAENLEIVYKVGYIRFRWIKFVGTRYKLDEAAY